MLDCARRRELFATKKHLSRKKGAIQLVDRVNAQENTNGESYLPPPFATSTTVQLIDQESQTDLRSPPGEQAGVVDVSL